LIAKELRSFYLRGAKVERKMLGFGLVTVHPPYHGRLAASRPWTWGISASQERKRSPHFFNLGLNADGRMNISELSNSTPSVRLSGEPGATGPPEPSGQNTLLMENQNEKDQDL
jgi:hypothetical protein